MSIRVLGAFFVAAIWSSVVDASGACCFSNLSCLIMTQSDCSVIPNSLWAGDGTDCSDKNGDALPDACFPHVGQSVYWAYYLPDPPADRFAIQKSDLDGVKTETILYPYVDFGEQGPNLFAAASHHTKLYWGNNSLDVVRRTFIDGTGCAEPVLNADPIPCCAPTGRNPTPLAIDPVHGKLYWATPNLHGIFELRRANIDGTSIEDFAGQIVNTSRLTLDVTGEKMYWTETTTGAIRRANLNGTAVQDVVTEGGDKPFTLALNPPAGKVYWSGEHHIYRANVDGTGPIETIVQNAGWCPGLGLDLAQEKMYWVDPDTFKLRRATLDGTNVQEVLTLPGAPFWVHFDFTPAPVLPAVCRQPFDRDVDSDIDLADFAAFQNCWTGPPI